MFEAGQQFGLYVIKEVCHASDKLAYCRAEDPFFNREVAITIYGEEQFLGGEQLEQLEALLENLAGLDHPSIAPIYDSGREAEFFYYTSACYPDNDLAQRLKNRLPEDQALKIVLELAQALDYALEQDLSPGKLAAEKIFFDTDDRAVMLDFGVEPGIERIIGSDQAQENGELAGSVAETLRSLGELLLKTLLGPEFCPNERIDDQVARIKNAKIRRLVGRFLLPGEWRFASYAELLEELDGFDAVAGLLKKEPLAREFDGSEAFDSRHRKEPQTDDQTETMVTEVRRLVAEKNGLQQALDKALYERNLAGNKLAEGEHQLAKISQEIEKAREEANVAWELVAGQKYDRLRPAAWAVGGFVVGFLLSGSYGYYYSEQTRNELLAKLKANEELIKNAAWRPAEKASTPKTVAADQRREERVVVAAEPAAAPSVAPASAESLPQGLVTEAEAEEEARQAVRIEVSPVAEEPRHWWPAGSEFSVTAAIPIEQIKAALGIENDNRQEGLSAGLLQEVQTALQRWADSWANQDLSNYFSAYSENYRPELGRSQQEWREIRRTRVSRPQWIKLEIDDLRLRKLSEDRIQVKIRQSYRSDFYQDDILKSINLIKEDGEWRILMERSLGMISDPVLVGG